MNQFDKIAAEYDESIYPLNEREFVLPTVDKLADINKVVEEKLEKLVKVNTSIKISTN